MATRNMPDGEKPSPSPGKTAQQFDGPEFPWWIQSPFPGLWFWLIAVIGTITAAVFF